MTESVERLRVLRPRRFLQFSLGTLLLGITVFGVWLGVQVNRARRQREAVAAIQRLGGAVLYDYQFDAQHKQVSNAQPTAPAWLRKVLGDDFFYSPVSIYLGGIKFNEGDLAPLEKLPELDWLYLGSCDLPDGELAHCQPLGKLRSLDIGGTSISDAGLAHLIPLKRLEWLDIQSTQVTDAGIATLTQLPRLTEVFVYGSQIGDEGRAELKRALPNCKIDRR
jgi:hypothetical protein